MYILSYLTILPFSTFVSKTSILKKIQFLFRQVLSYFLEPFQELEQAENCIMEKTKWDERGKKEKKRCVQVTTTVDVVAGGK